MVFGYCNRDGGLKVGGLWFLVSLSTKFTQILNSSEVPFEVEGWGAKTWVKMVFAECFRDRGLKPVGL